MEEFGHPVGGCGQGGGSFRGGVQGCERGPGRPQARVHLHRLEQRRGGVLGLPHLPENQPAQIKAEAVEGARLGRSRELRVQQCQLVIGRPPPRQPAGAGAGSLFLGGLLSLSLLAGQKQRVPAQEAAAAATRAAENVGGTAELVDVEVALGQQHRVLLALGRRRQRWHRLVLRHRRRRAGAAVAHLAVGRRFGRQTEELLRRPLGAQPEPALGQLAHRRPQRDARLVGGHVACRQQPRRK
eukprot:scaffold3410_cov105-Isochrysis_galbana.AAC.3